MPSSSWGIYRFQTLASSLLSGGGDGDHHGRKEDLAGGGGAGEEAEPGPTRPLLRVLRNREPRQSTHPRYSPRTSSRGPGPDKRPCPLKAFPPLASADIDEPVSPACCS